MPRVQAASVARFLGLRDSGSRTARGPLRGLTFFGVGQGLPGLGVLPNVAPTRFEPESQPSVMGFRL